MEKKEGEERKEERGRGENGIRGRGREEEKMKNENKMRGRGVQFGLKGGNQNYPKFKNQKKMTLRERGIEVKKLNRKRKEKERREE